ncbi:MAG: response regulator [Chloroflexota bacterium]
MLLQHVQQPPPRPTLINPDLPMALENVILKTLEKNRDRRFNSAQILAEALRSASPNTRPESEDRAATIPKRPDWTKTLAAQKPATKLIRVVMADDHKLLRATLANYLGTQDDIMVVAQAQDGDEALEKTLEQMPDVLLLDLNMPGKNGLDALPDIRKQAPEVKVLVLTGRDEDNYIMRALRAGAHGYVLKSTDEEKLVESIRQVMQGDMVLGRGIAEKVVSGVMGGDSNALSDREMEVLLHIAAGMENDEIADKLDLGITKLVEINAQLLDKLGVRDRTSAALKALREGIILVEDIHELYTRY